MQRSDARDLILDWEVAPLAAVAAEAAAAAAADVATAAGVRAAAVLCAIIDWAGPVVLTPHDGVRACPKTGSCCASPASPFHLSVSCCQRSV